MKSTAEELLDEIQNKVETLCSKLEQRENIKSIIQGKKNSHLHIVIETSLLEKIKKKANEENVSIAEYARKRLREDNQLNRIEAKIDSVLTTKHP